MVVKAELSKLKTDAVIASSENSKYQAKIKKLESEATIMRYLTTEIDSVTSENVRAKARYTQRSLRPFSLTRTGILITPTETNCTTAHTNLFS